MNKNKSLILGCMLLATVVLFWRTDYCRAQSQNPIGPQTSHDTDAIMERKMKRITPEQRIAAAAQLKAERLAEDPALAAKEQAAREETAKVAKARMEALQNADAPDAKLHEAAADQAAAREAQARNAAVEAAEAATEGGSK